MRATLAAANANRPKGAVEDGDRRWQIYANDQAKSAADYLPLIVSYRNGAAIQLSDVADVVDSVQDLRNAGMANSKPSVLVIIYRQPNANIIETVDRVTALLPSLRASIPGAITLTSAMERTATIRGSLRDTGRALGISIVLVVLVVFVFLRNIRATLIPGVAVPVSLVGTFGAMYLLGFSVNNFTLMALTIATGFVVDDAIVVLENTSRHIERGMPPFTAALQGAREVGFTVLAMSLSLIAVFIPILMMGGIIGRLFREFAITLVGGDPGLAGGVADDDADDVRASAAAAARRPARAALPVERIRFRSAASRVPSQPRVRARARSVGDAGAARHRLPQCLPVCRHPQGILPAAGYGTAGGRHPGGPEHLVPGDAPEAGRFHDHRRP